jgi:hypothetical protein
VYSREIDGQEYTFGVSGKLIMNVLVMYDRQTNSLWAQLLGEAVEGPLKGTKLEFLPAVHTTWADWAAQHPNTLALVKGYSGAYSGYQSYFNSDRAGVIGESVNDGRLYVKEFVIGVEYHDEAVAYPFSVLNNQPVVNDQIGDLPVLVVFNAETGAGAVFSRQLNDGRALTFEAQDCLTLLDNETGSTWDGRSGIAIDGPLAGSQLEPQKSTASFWFGWKDWFPHTRIYGLE